MKRSLFLKLLHKFFIFSFLILCLPVTGKAEMMRIGVMQQHPYGFQQDNETKGYLFDIAHLVLKTARIDGQVEVLPHKRLHTELREGSQTCSFFASTSFVTENYKIHEPLGKKLDAVVLPRKSVVLNEYRDLSGIRIGVPRGVFIDPRFDGDTQLDKHATVDYRRSIQMLRHGRVDAVVGAYDSLLYNMKEIGMATKHVGKPLVFHTFPLVLACRKQGETQLIDRLNKAIATLRETGELNQIIESYIGEVPTH